MPRTLVRYCIAMKLITFHFLNCLFLFVIERVPYAILCISFSSTLFFSLNTMSGNFIVACSLRVGFFSIISISFSRPRNKIETSALVILCRPHFINNTPQWPSSSVTTITFISLVTHLITVFFAFTDFYFAKMNCSSWMVMVTIVVG